MPKKSKCKLLAWLIATLLIAAATAVTFRPGPVNLGIVADVANQMEQRETEQMAIEALLTTSSRPGDSVVLVTQGQPLFRFLQVHPAVQSQFVHTPDLDLAAAVGEVAKRLGARHGRPTILVVLANPAVSTPLGDQAFRDLPSRSRIRLVGATVRPGLSEFLNGGLWKHDLRVAPASDLASAMEALVREVYHLRGYRPTPFTGIVLGSSLLAMLLLLVRRWCLRRRRIEVLFGTVEDDLQLVSLQDGEQFEVVSGATLQREGGRVRLIGAFPEEADRERWLAPGDEIEWTPGDEAWPIRVCLLRT